MRRYQDGFGLLMPNVTTPTDDENRELIRRAQSGDIGARNECVTRNIPLVVRIIKRHSRWCGFPDLVQEGSIGLCRAIDLFDLDLGIKFSTYASHWIKQATRLYLATSDVIRIPTHVQYESKAREERMAKDRDFRDRMDEMMKDRDRVRAGVYSLNTGGRGWHGAESNNVAIAEDVDHAGRIDDADTFAAVQREIRCLPPRHAEVVRRRFGLDGRRPETLREIGEDMGITREYVRQIERDAVRRLYVALDGLMTA